MGRFLAGVASALLLAAAGMFFWQGAGANSGQAVLPGAPPVEERPFTLADIPRAPSAPEETKEEKRFGRYDKDENGAINLAEYTANRRKGYDRLDVNRDGVLSFAEYVQKTSDKFRKADRDRTGVLSRVEFAATKPVRKARPKPDCPPMRPLVAKPVPGGDEGGEDDAA